LSVKKKRFRYRYIVIGLLIIVGGIYYIRGRIPLKSVIIKGTTRKGEVLSHLKFPKGIRIFSVNEESIKKNLFTIPWIKDVKVHKFFTGDLIIIIKKRKPVVYFRSSKPIGVEEDGSNFPLDSIPKNIPELVGGNFSPDALEWALCFVKLLNNKKFARKIYTSPEGPITYYKNFKIIWGKGNYNSKERYLQGVLRLKFKKGILDLRFNNQVVYRKEVRNG